MSIFDDCFLNDVEAAEALMSEILDIGGVSVPGIVSPIESTNSATPGGKRVEDRYEIHISEAVHALAAPIKGTKVIAGSITTRVTSVVSMGGAGYRLETSAENPRGSDFF